MPGTIGAGGGDVAAEIAVVAAADRERVVRPHARALRHVVDQAARRGVAVERGHRALDHLDLPGVAELRRRRAAEAVAQDGLRKPAQRAAAEGEADGGVGQIGDTAVSGKKRQLFRDAQQLEVLEKLMGDHLDLVRQIDDRRVGPRARHRLRGEPGIAVARLGDLELGNRDDFFAGARVGGPRAALRLASRGDDIRGEQGGDGGVRPAAPEGKGFKHGRSGFEAPSPQPPPTPHKRGRRHGKTSVRVGEHG